jgi:hypothetical protein
VQTIAHKIIPSFSIMGFSAEHEELAKTIQEYAGSQQHVEQIPALVSQLIDVLEHGVEELEQEKKDLIRNSNP